MDNRGQITVFLCLILTSMLLIGLTSLEVIRLNTGRAMLSQAAKGAMENLKAGYNRELFEAYHLLMLDKNCNGRGEAGLEALTEEYLEYTLGESDIAGVRVTDVILTGSADILQDECKPLKEQITEYMKYKSEISAANDLIRFITDGEEMVDDVQSAVEEGKNEKNENESDWAGDDPREVLKDSTGTGLLAVVTPDGTVPSKEAFDMEDFPSQINTEEANEDMNINFEDIDILEAQLGISNSDCIASFQENYYGMAYALECFDYYTCDKIYDNPMKCEVEYMICGKDNDYDNLSSVVNKIVLHRMPFNFMYLISDKEKIAEIEAIAITLALLPGITYAAVKYLLIGCWSYAETLVEIKSLLAGNKIPYIKTKDTWLTDINKLGNLANIKNLDYEGPAGIDYKGFLMILMAEHTSKLYYRIADIIQLNMRQFNDSFRMKDMIYACTFDISGECDGKYADFIKSRKNVIWADENGYSYHLSMEAGY